jgi:hypothetical protein
MVDAHGGLQRARACLRMKPAHAHAGNLTDQAAAIFGTRGVDL